jgi:NAD+ synthase (glutamine-hydrolysing)
MAQLNPVVGDIQGNLNRLIEIASQCSADSVDLLVLPELFLVGYPPRDLLQRPAFIDQVQSAVAEIVEKSLAWKGTGVIIGVPTRTGRTIGHGLYNSALLIYDGQILFAQHKSLLPTYDVFDEARYFDPGRVVKSIVFKGMKLGITICEDIWNEPELWKGAVTYDFDPVAELKKDGIDILINISASPYFLHKEDVRCQLISKHARDLGVPVVYVNQVGANDELVFDGQSVIVDSRGEVVLMMAACEESIQIVDTATTGQLNPDICQPGMELLYKALVLGIRDYYRKCGFTRAILGLSGGIDSALTACLAVEALGKNNVIGVLMPSMYSSAGSVDDSKRLAENLDMVYYIIPIEDIFNVYINSLQGLFAGLAADITEENIQARIRGNLLMALSNKFGAMVLSTGNKSEIAMGYCTLYGDMCGGLSVLADVPKTMVYELSNYINQEQEVIPRAIIEKPPSAELKPGQVDQDTLPPYSVLDTILNYYIEENMSSEQIIALGYDRDMVHWIIKTVNHNEYKRKQAAPGLKVSSRAFGAGRRMPVAAKFES